MCLMLRLISAPGLATRVWAPHPTLFSISSAQASGQLAVHLAPSPGIMPHERSSSAAPTMPAAASVCCAARAHVYYVCDV